MTDDELDIKTYSLAEVAETVLPPGMTNDVRWLAHRLNSGLLSRYRVGLSWRMTCAHVEELIERHLNHGYGLEHYNSRHSAIGGQPPVSRLSPTT
jgi:hypothetical protein